MRMLHMHPRTLFLLRERLLVQEAGASTRGMTYALDGMPIIASTSIPEFVMRWQFPDDHFVDYEESDEKWCRYFGIGHDVETNERALFIVDHGEWPLTPRWNWTR